MRIVIKEESALGEDLAGSVKGPMKEAPASSKIVSPGCAALIADCRLPPAGTVSVAARVALGIQAYSSKKIAMVRMKRKVERKEQEGCCLRPHVIVIYQTPLR